MEQQSEEKQLANNGTSFLKPPRLSSSNVDDVESPTPTYSNTDLVGNPDQTVPRDDEIIYNQPIEVRRNKSPTPTYSNMDSAGDSHQPVPSEKFSKSPTLSSPNADDVESLIHNYSNIDLASDPNRSVPRDDEMRYSRVPPYTIQPIKVRPNYDPANNFRVRVPELETFWLPSNNYRTIEQPTVEPDHFDDQVNRLHHFEDQRSLWERERSEPVVIRARYFDDEDKMRHSKREGPEPLAFRSHYLDVQKGYLERERFEPLLFRSRFLDVKRGYPMRERFDIANISHHPKDQIRHSDESDCETIHDYGMPMSERLGHDFQPESTAKGYPKSDPHQRDEISNTASRNSRMHSTWNNKLERIGPNSGGRNEVTGCDEFDNYELDWSIEKGQKRRLKEEQEKLMRRKKKTEKTNRS